MHSEIKIYGSRTIRVKKVGGGFDEATLGFSQLPSTAEPDEIRHALRVGEHVLEELRDAIEIQLGIHPSQRPADDAPKPALAGIFSGGAPTEFQRDAVEAKPATPPKPKRREVPERISMSDLHAMGPQMSSEEEQALIADLEDEEEIPETTIAASIADALQSTGELAPTPGHDVTDPFDARNQADIVPTRTATDPAAYAPDPEDLPTPIVQQIADMPIPDNVEIQPIFTGVLGIRLNVPPDDDERWSIPLTDINRDETGGGQLKAVNAAITGAGFSQKERHQVCDAILNGIDRERPPVSIESTRDLSQAQAHVILSWFDRATDVDLTRLGNVARGVAI